MFLKSTWHSDRLGCAATLARWGHMGQPVLLLPTAGGDAEECERFQMIRVLAPLLEKGLVKVYSCDSLGGQALFDPDKSPEQRLQMQGRFQQYLRHEVVPAIRMDCKSDLDVWVAGASIGAFHAAAALCRFPDVFSRALCMSGTYKLLRFTGRADPTPEFFVSSPLHFLPTLEGPHLTKLQSRYIHIASGEGSYEDISESWNLARVLGSKGIPNHVDSWGPGYHHDWVTWREMLPGYLETWTRPRPG